MREETGKMNRILKNIPKKEGKCLTFSLSDEEYGIGILKIKEIIGMMPITTVPQTPAFGKGVINLRRKVIPVVDLRLRFDMGAKEYTERTYIIVVETKGRSGNVFMGIVSWIQYRKCYISRQKRLRKRQPSVRNETRMIFLVWPK